MCGVRIAYHGAVVVVDNTIVVEVLEAYVARLGTCLNGVFFYFQLVLEYSVGDITVEHVDGQIVGEHRYVRVVQLIDIVRHVAVETLYLVAVVCIAKIVGCTLPMFAKKLGFDPAVMASPFITTIVDAISLLIYFGIATRVLGI